MNGDHMGDLEFSTLELGDERRASQALERACWFLSVSILTLAKTFQQVVDQAWDTGYMQTGKEFPRVLKTTHLKFSGSSGGSSGVKQTTKETLPASSKEKKTTHWLRRVLSPPPQSRIKYGNRAPKDLLKSVSKGPLGPFPSLLGQALPPWTALPIGSANCLASQKLQTLEHSTNRILPRYTFTHVPRTNSQYPLRSRGTRGELGALSASHSHSTCFQGTGPKNQLEASKQQHRYPGHHLSRVSARVTLLTILLPRKKRTIKTTTRKAEETPYTSNKEKETHWLRRAMSHLHHEATKQRTLMGIWRVTGSTRLQNL
eukprot:1158756-Pelagomonas_calceolata.AAC.3